MTGAHYRSKLAFSTELLRGADSAVRRLNEFALRLGSISSDAEPAAEARGRWDAALDEDLNLPAAVGHLFEFVKLFNTRIEAGNATPGERAAAIAFLHHANRVLDVIEFPGDAVDAEVEALIAEREEARRARNFARSDEIRQQLLAMGISLEDTRDGPRWKRSS
jgi:cysteinyl-tRNA synthetase